MNLLLYGAGAGYAMWITCFPIDVIKSRMQTDTLDAPRYANARDCWRQTIGKEGFRALFRGYVPVLARAAPTNAATFLTYELASNYLYGN